MNPDFLFPLILLWLGIPFLGRSEAASPDLVPARLLPGLGHFSPAPPVALGRETAPPDASGPVLLLNRHCLRMQEFE
jgi:hypothetical protein